MTGSRKKAKWAVWGLIVLFVLLSSLPFLVKGCGLLALLSFTPLFCIDEICRREQLRGAGWYGFTALALFNIATTFWVWFVSPAGAIAALLLNSLFMFILYALFRWSRKLCKKGGKWLPYLFFAAIWLAWEHIYFNIDLTWPWLTLGYAFATSHKLIQWYEITGTLGGSLWILTASILAFWGLREAMDGRRKAAWWMTGALAAVVLIPSICSLVRYYSYQEKGESIEVALIQPSVDPFQRHGHGTTPQQQLDEEMIALAESVVTPETRYLITPETVTYGIILHLMEMSPSVCVYQEFLKEHPQLNLLFGSLTTQHYYTDQKPSTTARKQGYFWYDRYNTAILINSTDIFGYYHKSRLVPGTECIPFLEQAPWLGRIIEKFGGASGSYGRMKEMLALEGSDGNKVVPMICYESVYGDYSRGGVRNGGNFMAVMTNDAWWGDTPGYRQHFRYAALRAIENRRDVVQAANTGLSGYFNQRGDVLQQTSWWTKEARVGEVHLNDELTPFTLKGDVIGRWAKPVSLLLALLVLASFVWGKRSARGKSAADNS